MPTSTRTTRAAGTRPAPGGDRLPRLEPEQMRAMGKTEARALTDVLLRRLAALDPADPAYGYVRGTLIELSLPLVRYVAASYRHRHESMDDIVQVGVVGLIKAVDAYDVDRGVEFSTFAIPTISGEIKRYFRDTSWPVHVPRRVQELYLAVARGSDRLEQDLGRAPSTDEIAAYLHVRACDVDDGIRAARAYRIDRLDALSDPGDDQPGTPLSERLGQDDNELELTEVRETLGVLLSDLPPRERTIVLLRFWGNLTQVEIAERIGVSQMHVSRLLSGTLRELRARWQEEDDPGRTG
ncbi:SigB/SigF/SigG family RNA polymerase sigma factor [Streptantibioticus parmotrematis]|uniref:SigB/SigF/SigG family RNA polymerase sigma factor n=1 Tax=Streptantibioticus parmotrematis TaxID=2873249 RepID=UPI0033DFD192